MKETETGTERDWGRQAGAKPWRGAFWHNDSHLPLTGLGKVKLIMTAHRCWIALDEVNNWQSNKQVLNDFCYLPWNYRMFWFFPARSSNLPKGRIMPPYNRDLGKLCEYVNENNTYNNGRQKACSVTCTISMTNRKNCHRVECAYKKKLLEMKGASLCCSGNRCQHKSISTETCFILPVSPTFWYLAVVLICISSIIKTK